MFVDDEYSAAACRRRRRRCRLLRVRKFDNFFFNVADAVETSVLDDLLFGDLFREQVVAFEVPDGLDYRVQVLSGCDDE